ncbi:type I-F CRISPR-associated protein Csy2 [Rheinheimera sp. UJ63]|uniref:type I-F CRISPR-associated protein Csy2 n=1 Tax=Rheinheimera sp. UJ63 TaxID=2910157 RepID=UPI001F46CBFC|nr:type I-F CRISPR-associated protein Csy2 [Rheinheimera sp. UJ63]MCF4010652.1 type I-F CRISPR-associated protein Csy2 [Rheinheimera sp. UJ63]
MNGYILLDRIEVQNANCIAGLTYGFPAITHFLGYTHALSRVLKKEIGLELTGCGIVCHEHQIQVHRIKNVGHYVFSQARKPLNNKAASPAENEEGRMSMTISLILEVSRVVTRKEYLTLTGLISKHAVRQRLAGGQIMNIADVGVYGGDDKHKLSKQVLRKVLPGFALIDRSLLLERHFKSLLAQNEKASRFDAWLDFASLKYRATPPPEMQGDDDNHKVEWELIPKPEQGYLVPLMTGYCAISELYKAGVVNDTRDPNSPFCFVESVYGVGQWISPLRVLQLDDIIWRYEYKPPLYICKTSENSNPPQLITEQEAMLAETEITFF